MDLYTWVCDGFTRFKDVWEFSDFWKRANTHHAYLRFAAAAEKRFPNSAILPDIRALRMKLIGANNAYFRSEYQKPVYWADDFGWWGIALLASAEALNATGDPAGAAQQLALAQVAWQEMIKRGYDKSPNAQPIPFGCANKSPDSPSGAKNTVTNANLFLLSVRLYAALAVTSPGEAVPYLEKMRAQLAWFAGWFNGTQGYLRTFENKSYGLVQERPIAEPDYMDKQRPTWEPGWLWSGDQGLLIAALAELTLLPRGELGSQAKEQGEAAQEVNQAFSQLFLGVRRLLCGADAVLREAPFKSTFGPDYAGDYVAGRGILIRYLSEPSVLRVRGTPFPPEVITATATAVWNSREKSSCQFAADWTPGNNSQFNQAFREKWGQGDVNVSWDPNCGFEGVRQAAGLDVLTAAMSLG